jgi:hypothetical protein
MEKGDDQVAYSHHFAKVWQEISMLLMRYVMFCFIE